MSWKERLTKNFAKPWFTLQAIGRRISTPFIQTGMLLAQVAKGVAGFMPFVFVAIAPLAAAFLAAQHDADWSTKHVFPALIVFAAAAWLGMIGLYFWRGFKTADRRNPVNSRQRDLSEDEKQKRIEEIRSQAALDEVFTNATRGTFLFFLGAAFSLILWRLLDEPSNPSSQLLWMLGGLAAGCLVLAGYLLKRED